MISARLNGMNPYSQDLRNRVLAALKAGQKSQAEVAETFGVSLSTIEKWWHRWQATGQIAALPRRSGPKRTLAECDDLIRTIVQEQPDVTLDELCARVTETQAISASRSMMCRTLQQLDLPRKKSRSTTVSGIRRG
jgi:transposase